MAHERAASPFFAIDGAVELPDAVDHGVPSHYGSPNIEQRELERGLAVVDLSNRSVVSVAGPDRLSWLHSLSSQDVARLAPGIAGETLFLDPQGHLEYAVKVIDDGETAWLLVEPAVADAFVSWLDRMRFMLRVEVADRSADVAVIGVVGVGVELPVLVSNGVALRWDDPWAHVVAGGYQYAGDEHPGADWVWSEVLVSRDSLAVIAQRVAAGEVKAAGSLAAEALRVAAWRPRQATEADERTIPHELDWLRTAVHLTKGCYRGQETVAKVHNLGHPPRRLVMLHLDGSDVVLPAHGARVTVLKNDEVREVGYVTTSAVHHVLGPVALAVIKRAVPADAELTVDEEGVSIAASQQVIVPASAGAVAEIPRLPRLGVQTRR